MKRYYNILKNIFNKNKNYESVSDILIPEITLKDFSLDELINEINNRRKSSIDNMNQYEIKYMIGKTTGNVYIGDQCGGMTEAKCHACGLGYKCLDSDCPNDTPNPVSIYKI